MLGVVVIGRNEGQRLLRCLRSLSDHIDSVVYVDSGSTDGSVTMAKAAGALVVELDNSRPFSAARARNAGVAALIAKLPELEWIQFIDGDCEIIDGWLDNAISTLQANPGLGIVTGWCVELHRHASVYNALCDIEWRRPPGDIESCGGNMMVRFALHKMIDGFDEAVMAAEDDEYCFRIRQENYRIMRLPIEMVVHDAAITSFWQWWRRCVRTGHAFAQVGTIHPSLFVAERRRVVFWAVAVPAAGIMGAAVTPWAPLTAIGLYAISLAKTALALRGQASSRELLPLAGLLTLTKIPNFIGLITYYRRVWLNRSFQLIEYK